MNSHHDLIERRKVFYILAVVLPLIALLFLSLGWAGVVQIDNLERLVIVVCVSAPIGAVFADMVNARNYRRPLEDKLDELRARMIEAVIPEGLAFAYFHHTDVDIDTARETILSHLNDALQLQESISEDFGSHFPRVLLDMKGHQAALSNAIAAISSVDDMESARKAFGEVAASSKGLDTAVSKKAINRW